MSKPTYKELKEIDKMFLSGSCWRLSRLFSVIALICMATMINACGNPFGYEDMNDEFWSNHSEMRTIAEQRMENAKSKLKTLDDVRELQKLFNYVPEPVDWIPTIEVLFARNLTDDCDGATILGKWSLAQIGIKSRVVDLYGNEIHAVCISEDNTIMITNNEVVRIPQDHWKEAVLTYFQPPYKSLKVVN